jgi:hypothetical protein
VPIIEAGFKKQEWKKSQYLHTQIRFMSSDQSNMVSGMGMEEAYLFHTIHKSRNLSSKTKTAAFQHLERSCTYKLNGAGFCSPDGRRTTIWDNGQSLTVLRASNWEISQFISFSAKRSINTQPIQYHQQIAEMASLLEACYPYGARGGVVGWGTTLQTRTSRVWFPMVSLEFFIDIIVSFTLWPWGRLSL